MTLNTTCNKSETSSFDRHSCGLDVLFNVPGELCRIQAGLVLVLSVKDIKNAIYEPVDKRRFSSAVVTNDHDRGLFGRSANFAAVPSMSRKGLNAKERRSHANLRYFATNFEQTELAIVKLTTTP
jgi:hypothetical protein